MSSRKPFPKARTGAEIRSSRDIPADSSLKEKTKLVLQGGGMKGLGVVSALERLEETGILPQIDEMAGSSVGSIVATLAAVGYTSKELRAVMMALDFRALQDKDVVGWLESTRVTEILGTMGDFAGGVMDRMAFLKRLPILSQEISYVYDTAARVGNISKTASNVLKKAETVEDVVGLLLGENLGLWKGEALENLMAGLIALKTGKPHLTFRELAVLAENPKTRCKKLIMTVTDLTDRTTEYHSAKNTPDEPIVKSVRKSASFPGAFKAVQEKDAEGNIHLKSDGGIRKNIPDIFHTPEYYERERGDPELNPEVLAIVFEPVQKKKLDKTKKPTGKELMQDLLKTLTSEKEVVAKYDPKNIIHIDTKGVDTLDFDIDEATKKKLADSGGESTNRLFQRTLASEAVRPPDYRTWPLKRLIRNQAIIEYELSVLENQFKRNPSPRTEKERQRVIQVHAKILTIIQQKLNQQSEITNEVYHKMVSDEFERRKKRGEVDSGHVLTDQELLTICEERLGALKRDQEIEDRLKQLDLELIALKFRKNYIQEKFGGQHKGVHFHTILNDLSKSQILLKNNRSQRSNWRIQLLSKKISQRDYQSKVGQLDAIYHLERSRFLDRLSKLIAENEPDPFLSSFYQEIKTRLLEDPDFKIPVYDMDLLTFLNKEIFTCRKMITRAEAELKHKQEMVKTLESRKAIYAERTDKGEQYRALMDLKREVDVTVNRHVRAVAKIDAYFWDKVPILNRVISGFCRFIGFTVLMGVSLGPISLPIAMATRKWSSNPKYRHAANWFITNVTGIINPSTIRAAKKLEGFQQKLSELIDALNKNYGRAEKVEHSYLYRLVFLHLKQMGLKFEDLVLRKPNETEPEYTNRINLFKRSLKVEELERSPLIQLGTNKKVELLKPFESDLQARKTAELQANNNVIMMEQSKEFQTLKSPRQYKDVEKLNFKYQKKLAEKEKEINKKYELLHKQGLKEIEKMHQLLKQFEQLPEAQQKVEEERRKMQLQLAKEDPLLRRLKNAKAPLPKDKAKPSVVKPLRLELESKRAHDRGHEVKRRQELSPQEKAQQRKDQAVASAKKHLVAYYKRKSKVPKPQDSGERPPLPTRPVPPKPKEG